VLNGYRSDAGARLRIGAQECSLEGAREYPDLYRRFAQLIDLRQSEVDVAPLRLIADAFLCGGGRGWTLNLEAAPLPIWFVTSTESQ